MQKHLVLVLLVLVLAGCSKSEEGASGSPSASASASAAASASASASASATASATASASASDTASAAPTPSAAPTAKATTAASGGPATCGTKPLPDCPLQGWMKKNTNAAMAASDFDALNKALEKTATFAPSGYTNWASISKDGARAARQADLAAVKASCRGCHDQYKKKYKDELRTRPIP